MLMKTVSKEKQSKKLDIFQMAEQVKREETGRDEAAQIMRAYRKVQDIKVQNKPIKDKDKKLPPKKAESTYANKVKETLKEMNINRHKEQNQVRSKQIEFKKERSSAERHLINSGCKKIFKIVLAKFFHNLQSSLDKIKKSSQWESESYEEMVRLWKLRRIFSGWQYEAMLSKIEKARVEKEAAIKLKKSIQLADDFRYFTLIKRSLKHWKKFTIRSIKEREAKEEERNFQIAQLLKEEHPKQAAPTLSTHVEKNQHLQNKLRGFLDNLKHEIDDRQGRRLNTIKEKTEDSELAVRQETHSDNPLIEENQQQQQEQRREGDGQSQNDQQDPVEQREQNRNNGPLTNEELEKRRKQLAQKAKSRKQALERLKKQKESKKKKDQQERLRIQKQVEEEQKRIRQEQYRNFLKQKRQQEQWEEKQRQLSHRADQFNRLRLLKFYGWLHWQKLRQCTQSNLKVLEKILTEIVLRRKLVVLIEGINQIGNEKLHLLQLKAQRSYQHRLKRKVIQGFQEQKQEQLELREELTVRHEVNTLKIYLKSWIRVRPDLQLQNFQWERPRLKRAECLYSMTLMQKALESLRLNKEEEVQARNIQQHKAKIKEKVQLIVEQKPTIDYDDFL